MKVIRWFTYKSIRSFIRVECHMDGTDTESL